MTLQSLPAKSDRFEGCIPALARQLALLECWWKGWSLRQMAETHGISRSRVAAILRDLGCRTGGCPNPIHRRADSQRPVPAQRLARARALLVHPRFARLTVRQRAAVAWTALGLSSRDVARRMELTGQRVRCLLVSAESRLQRLTPRPANHEDPTDITPMPALCWDGFLELSTGQMPEENPHAD